jgi:ADP-heptose:LPS heptosyltransferase/glycosyltransferase involved in cell wall biosynthesis
MKKILLVGEHPYSITGNGNMMRAILNQINFNEYETTCFVANDPGAWEIPHTLPYKTVLAQDLEAVKRSTNERVIDPWGKQKLAELISNSAFDVVLTVGLDIWRYAEAFGVLMKLRDDKRFKWGAIFPFDLQNLRSDWTKWISIHEYPCVYSMYGFNKLRPMVHNLRYFRPPLADSELFVPIEDKKGLRRKKFPSVDPNTFIFGFVGSNQTRKDPQAFIKAFSLLKKDTDRKLVLYLHTELGDQRGYNLYQYCLDCGLSTGDVLAKQGKYDRHSMAEVYNAIDCLVNCTMQEGLSWTPLEAMLCGTPVIVSDSTSHPELVGDAGVLVPCETPTYLQVVGKTGPTYVDAKCCKAEDIYLAMKSVLSESSQFGLERMKQGGLARAKEWISGVSDVNALLSEMTNKDLRFMKKVIRAILFIQKSSAGDVFMTTRCFKGLKERHPGLPLIYMTSPQYMNIVEGNPYVDRIIPYGDINDQFEAVYNPHGERILPGHWGKNSNSILSDFYWKILRVEPDDFFIRRTRPSIRFDNGAPFKLEEWIENKDICVVHTTGGDAQFRTYKYMADVCEGLKDRYFTVQVGGKDDFPAGADLDLRGRLTFQETAWVMERASVAVTVDSFVSHLAGALGIPQVCLFGSGNVYVCRPNQLKGELVCLVPDYIRDCKGLGPCSASVRDCPHPCTGIHSPETILETIKEIENGDRNQKGVSRVKYAQRG